MRVAGFYFGSRWPECEDRAAAVMGLIKASPGAAAPDDRGTIDWTLTFNTALPGGEALAVGIDHAPAAARRRPEKHTLIGDAIAGFDGFELLAPRR